VPREAVEAPPPPGNVPVERVKVVRGHLEGAARSYLAVRGTDRDSDIGSKHHCECRGQFNRESTVKGRGGVEMGGGDKETSFIMMSTIEVWIVEYAYYQLRHGHSPTHTCISGSII